MLRLSWHGHSCWELRCEGRNLVIDPHDGHSVGIKPPSTKADVAVVTHDHFDHNATRVVEKVGGSTRVLVAPTGSHDAAPFMVRTWSAHHDTEGGRLRGDVRLVMVECDGLRVLHLSDLGHELDEAQCRAFGRVDVALVPAGEVFTVGAEAAWRTLDRLRPAIVAPMHYKTAGLGLPVHDLEPFAQGREVLSVGQSIDLEVEDLPEPTEIWQFNR